MNVRMYILKEQSDLWVQITNIMGLGKECYDGRLMRSLGLINVRMFQ